MENCVFLTGSRLRRVVSCYIAFLISCEQKSMYDLMRIGWRAGGGLIRKPELAIREYARSVWIFHVIGNRGAGER
ncbi:MAG: hypothetical protein U9N46_06055 [Euryarchaeota archaeon]|nr:hypothetical protein [Euryarchaeota archaeon]